MSIAVKINAVNQKRWMACVNVDDMFRKGDTKMSFNRKV